MSPNPDRLSLRPVRHVLQKLPTAQKLQLIVAVFVCIVLLVLTSVYAGSRVSAAARGYVGGEGLWSKAQKEAVIKLEQYATTRDEKNYREFQESLSVPAGDHLARLEMEKAHPDQTIAVAGFRQGKIAEGDIPGLIMLFRRFRRTQLIEGAFAEGVPLAACLLLLLGVAIAFPIVREIEASEAERSRAEAATRASEERYRELLENANDMVYVHDLEGHFLSWNRKTEAVQKLNVPVRS